jgi:hypothetical protein
MEILRPTGQHLHPPRHHLAQFIVAQVIELARLTNLLALDAIASHEHGRIINTLTSSARSEIAYLTSAHYIKRLSHAKLYVITERGREALKTIADYRWASCRHPAAFRRPGRSRTSAPASS